MANLKSPLKVPNFFKSELSLKARGVARCFLAIIVSGENSQKLSGNRGGVNTLFLDFTYVRELL